MNEEVLALAARTGVPRWRLRLAELVESPPVTRTVIAIILANAALMGLETHEPLMATHGDLIHLLDKICLAVFVVELVAKLVAYGLTFWRNGWRIFDFLVVAVALVPGAGPWAVLRSLRVLRVLRLLTIVPSLRRVVAAFLHAIPGLMGVIAVMLIIFYTGGVLATTLYSQSFPEFFGDLSKSLYSLFQIMTLDSWHSQIVRPMVEAEPSAGPFFLVFVVVTSFTVLNLFIGIIVTAMQEMADAEKEAEAAKAETKARKEAERAAKVHRAAREPEPGPVPSGAVGEQAAAGAIAVAESLRTADGASTGQGAASIDEIIARMERDLDSLRALAARR